MSTIRVWVSDRAPVAYGPGAAFFFAVMDKLKTMINVVRFSGKKLHIYNRLIMAVNSRLYDGMVASLL